MTTSRGTRKTGVFTARTGARTGKTSARPGATSATTGTENKRAAFLRCNEKGAATNRSGLLSSRRGWPLCLEGPLENRHRGAADPRHQFPALLDHFHANLAGPPHLDPLHDMELLVCAKLFMAHQVSPQRTSRRACGRVLVQFPGDHPARKCSSGRSAGGAIRLSR